MDRGSYSYYDLIGHIVPGSLILGLLYLFNESVKVVDLSFSASWVGVLGLGIAGAYITGVVLQALGSWIEPFLYLIWQGKPSTIAISDALQNGAANIPLSDFVRKVALRYGVADAANEPEATFKYAQVLVNRHGWGRSEQFVAHYALFRALIVSSLISTVLSIAYLIGANCSWCSLSADHVSIWVLVLIASVLSLFVFIVRGKERAYTYAREIISMAGISLINEEKP